MAFERTGYTIGDDDDDDDGGEERKLPMIMPPTRGGMTSFKNKLCDSLILILLNTCFVIPIVSSTMKHSVEEMIPTRNPVPICQSTYPLPCSQLYDSYRKGGRWKGRMIVRAISLSQHMMRSY